MFQVLFKLFVVVVFPTLITKCAVISYMIHILHIRWIKKT